MPKETPPTPPVPPPDPVVEELTLEEFCMRRSRVDRRVELIGAFYADQTRTQQFKATEDAFAARLDTFANLPV